MPNTVSVRFKYASRDLLFDAGTIAVQEADHVICKTERGTEIGIATSDVQELSDAQALEITSGVALKPVLRVATEEDLTRAEELARKGDDAMPAFRQMIESNELDMKPVGVEYLFDGDKLTCYFAAEERVDFRQLVRDLSRELHARIDMRQIGVREEAAVMGGFGHCGQELCCARFGLAFEPVSIRMAKEQDLPLNSTKISGACGRLMCCLRYEFEAYRDFKSRAPKKNAVIDTPLGKSKIIEYNTPKEELALRIENGKVIRIALADMSISSEAREKSEAQGCACRPDTVTREMLERLQSPDVQMALAELDRKNGELEFEESVSEDLFIQPKAKDTRGASKGHEKSLLKDTEPKQKRRRHERKPKEQDKAPVQERSDSSERLNTRRRHRSFAPNQKSEQEKTSAPVRRRKPGDKGGNLASTSTNENASVNSGARRRRRHHKSSDGASEDSSQH